MTRDSATPFDEQEGQIECPKCIGLKEIFEPYPDQDDDGALEGRMVQCPNCVGIGTLGRMDGYTKDDDFLDQLADEHHDEGNYFLDGE